MLVRRLARKARWCCPFGFVGTYCTRAVSCILQLGSSAVTLNRRYESHTRLIHYYLAVGSSYIIVRCECIKAIWAGVALVTRGLTDGNQDGGGEARCRSLLYNFGRAT